MEAEGYQTNITFTYLLKENEQKIDEFITIHKSQIIIYDIALPYEENYELFNRLRRIKSIRGISFILITTNKSVLESLVGKNSAYEIVGKPYGLCEIINAARNAYQHTYIA